MNGWAWAGIATGGWIIASCAAAPLIGRWLARGGRTPWHQPECEHDVPTWDHQPQAREAGTQPAPGADPVPGPTPATTGSSAGPPRTARAPAPDGHGGIRKTITVYQDGRAEITDHLTGRTETVAGDCHECLGMDGCTWCGFYPVYDPARRHYVRRYQKCPAHAPRERQP